MYENYVCISYTDEKKNGTELASTDGSNFATHQMGIIIRRIVYNNIYKKKSLPPEKTSGLNVYVSGTDGIFYTALALRVGSGINCTVRVWCGTCVEQIAEGATPTR